MCAGLGATVIQSHDQTNNQWGRREQRKTPFEMKKKKYRLSFLSFSQISEDRPDVSSACLALIDTVHCWSPGPGAVPSATNIRWLCDHTRHQVTRDPATKYTHLTHSETQIPEYLDPGDGNIFSSECFYKSPLPHFRFQDCETDPRSLPSSCLIVKYNTSIIFNIRNSVIRTIPKLRPLLPGPKPYSYLVRNFTIVANLIKCVGFTPVLPPPLCPVRYL